MHPKDLRIQDYTYELPHDRIAGHPLAHRGDSRLLVFKEQDIREDVYRNIASHIPSGASLVFNQTRVVHARLLFQKDTGGVIEVFCLEPHEQYGDIQNAMLQKGSVLWHCMIGGASKWKQGMVLSQSFPGELTLKAAIVARQAGSFTLELSWDPENLSFAEVLNLAGKVPLPPYLHREPEALDAERYQTVYASASGSVAAPTAGLHFTDEILHSLAHKGISTSFVTLHVGAGTFKPVKTATMEGHEMHAEWIDVPLSFIEHLLTQVDGTIVAVGTTSLRTLETLYWIGAKLLEHSVPDFSRVAISQWEPYELNVSDTTPARALQAVIDWMIQHQHQRLMTRTQILIAPGYRFRIVKGLITNFHQPQSTLLLLVAALIGDDWRRVYTYALNNGFRFLSYGDGSLLWAKNEPPPAV